MKLYLNKPVFKKKKKGHKLRYGVKAFFGFISVRKQDDKRGIFSIGVNSYTYLLS